MKEKKKTEKRPPVLKRMLRDLSKIRFPLLGVAAMALVIIACNMISPRLVGGIVGEIGDFADGGGGKFSSLFARIGRPLAWLLGVYAVYSLFSWLKMYTLNNVVSRRFTCELRIAMSDKISRLPLSRLDKMTTGEVLAKINNNVSTMGNSVHQAIDVLLMGGLQIVAIAAMLFLENVQMALATVLLVPLSTLLSTFLASRSMRCYEKLWKEYEALYSCVEETYGGMDTVRAFNMEESVREKHAEINARLTALARRAGFLSTVVQPVIALANHASFIVICLLGGILAVRGEAEVATVVTVVLYSKNFASPLTQIANGLSAIQQVAAAAGMGEFVAHARVIELVVNGNPALRVHRREHAVIRLGLVFRRIARRNGDDVRSLLGEIHRVAVGRQRFSVERHRNFGRNRLPAVVRNGDRRKVETASGGRVIVRPERTVDDRPRQVVHVERKGFLFRIAAVIGDGIFHRIIPHCARRHPAIRDGQFVPVLIQYAHRSGVLLSAAVDGERRGNGIFAAYLHICRIFPYVELLNRNLFPAAAARQGERRQTQCRKRGNR